MIRNLHVVSLIAGPLLGAVATFFWTGDRYGVTASVVLMYSTLAWIYGLLGIWDRIAAWRPWVGAAGIVLAVAGFAGGMAFALQGFFEAVFGVDGAASLEAVAEHPAAAPLVLWLPGAAFPISLGALGIALAWSRLAPAWTAALLIASAVVFPLSRITRIEWIAHCADALLLAAFTALALHYLRTGLRRTPAAT